MQSALEVTQDTALHLPAHWEAFRCRPCRQPGEEPTFAGKLMVTPETFKGVPICAKSKTGPFSKTLKSPDALQSETTKQQK